ncbi:MAG: hypothetical protein HRT88_05610 [Lentisphaeraceae bacterium]|nr:hypothetical protein [Lentisphaeraceae bacterium]
MSALIDGELESAFENKLMSHLDKCPECHSMFDDFMSMENLFQSTVKVEEVPHDWESIAAEINRTPRRRLPRLKLIAYCAAAVALFAFLLIQGSAPEAISNTAVEMTVDVQHPVDAIVAEEGGNFTDAAEIEYISALFMEADHGRDAREMYYVEKTIY